ncbi:MAG: CBU_0592 family membrane protein [Cytophagaceae bacterium]
MKLLINILGWIGAIEVLAAYFLVSFKKIDSTSFIYQFLNATGAVFLILLTVYQEAYPSAFVNVIWVGIAVYSIMKNKKRV